MVVSNGLDHSLTNSTQLNHSSDFYKIYNQVTAQTSNANCINVIFCHHSRAIKLKPY